MDECLNDDLQDVWEPRMATAWRKAALEQAREDFKEDLKQPGAYLYLHDTRTDDAG